MMEKFADQHRQFEFLNAVLLAPELLHDAVLQRFGVDPSGNNGLNDGWVVRTFDRGAATANRRGFELRPLPNDKAPSSSPIASVG